MSAPSRTSAGNAGPDQNFDVVQIILGKVRSFASTGRGPHPQVLIIAPEEGMGEVARTGRCPDCEQLVSLRATTCVHCGAPLSVKVPVDSTDENKWRQSMLRNSDDQTRYLRSFWVVLLVFLIANLVIGVVVLATSSG